MESFLKTFDLTTLDGIMILVWGVCFVILWKVLEKFVFAPYITLIDARDAATTGAQETAQKHREEAETLRVKFEDRMTEVRVAEVREKLTVLAAVRTDAQRTIEQAETAAQQRVKSAREENVKRLGTLRNDLARDCDEMARSIVAKVKSPAQAQVH